MLKTHFKIAWRNILRKRFYTILNISGLALSISCCILIFLYISYQLSFDTYHKKTDHIFRLVYDLHLDKTEYDKGSSAAMLRSLQTEFPQVEKAAISINNQSFVVRVNDEYQKRFREEKNISFANSDWFKMFQYHWLSGNPAQLDEPNTAVLTKKLAEKYFGDTNPIGKTLLIGKEQIRVIGIIADPANTDLKADMYISTPTFLKLNPAFGNDYFTSWGYTMSINSSFVYLKDTNQKGAVEKQLIGLVNKHMGKDSYKWFTFKLMPLEGMHFDTRYAGTIQKTLLTILMTIGVLILIIACINYINLVIAQQARRSREIGTRKVLGGSSKQLFIQFIIESLVTSGIAVTISVFLVLWFIPTANRLLFADEPIQILSYQNLFLFSAGMLLCVTIGTGVYPAFILSKVNIFQSLKNTGRNWLAGFSRKSLVVVQNIVAQALIICTIVIVMQVHFLKNTDKGFERESVVMIPFEKASDSQKEKLSHSLKAIPEVQSFSFCYQSPAIDTRRGATVKFDNRDWEAWPARFAIGDSAYCKTFGVRIIAGRTISANSATPEYLVNQMMASRLYPKHPQDVIGKKLSAGDQLGTIVGVVGDFNLNSLLIPIEPVVVLEDKNLQNNLAVKLSGRQTAATLNLLQKEYLRLFPDQVFSYQFVDDKIAELYKKETLQQKFIWIAAGIAIFISSLGLLGLILLITLQRTKEIGIRKVLGASVSQIVSLLSADFIKMILLAFIIASPVAWYAMTQWLQNFAYRIEIQWWMFALAGFMALLIAFITISIQSAKAAMANPVNSLRSE